MSGNNMRESPHARASGNELTLTPGELADLIRDVLAEGKSFRFRAPGLSMTPFIKDGDILTISPLASRRISAGDIVAVQHPDTKSVIVHRVIRLKGGHLITKGDNCRNHDGMMSPEDVLGRVTQVERNGRAVRLALGPARGIIAGLGRCGMLWVGLAVYRGGRNWVRVLLRREPLL